MRGEMWSVRGVCLAVAASSVGLCPALAKDTAGKMLDRIGTRAASLPCWAIRNATWRPNWPEQAS